MIWIEWMDVDSSIDERSQINELFSKKEDELCAKIGRY